MDATSLNDAYSAKARAELERADELADVTIPVMWSGDLLARVVLVKGAPGPADLETGRALAGDDGEAAGKAIEALGYSPGSVFATVSRPSGAVDHPGLRERLARQIEAVDPDVVIALDGGAAHDLAGALGIERIPFGQVITCGGRRVLAVDGLEASLCDESRKRVVWEQLKALAGES